MIVSSILQAWITPLYIGHLLLVVDSKSDNILIVVSSFFLEPCTLIITLNVKQRHGNFIKTKKVTDVSSSDKQG